MNAKRSHRKPRHRNLGGTKGVIIPLSTRMTTSTWHSPQTTLSQSAGKADRTRSAPRIFCMRSESLHAALLDKSQEFDHYFKDGKNPARDAVPMRLGQSFHAYATMIERDIRRIGCARKELFTPEPRRNSHRYDDQCFRLLSPPYRTDPRCC